MLRIVRFRGMQRGCAEGRQAGGLTVCTRDALPGLGEGARCNSGISLVALGILVLMWCRIALGKTFGRFGWRLKGSLGKGGS